jgi:hypothetical protein
MKKNPVITLRSSSFATKQKDFPLALDEMIYV